MIQRSIQRNASLHLRRRSVQAAHGRAEAMAVHAAGRAIPIALIRTGTSRGVFVRKQHLPSDPVDRITALLRLFGAQDGQFADGLGGERPALRKLAIVEQLPSGRDGIPVLGYTFGQVDASLRTIDFGAECGNIAAGVPLFASLHGWCAGPEAAGAAWLYLTNTRKRVLAEWQSGDMYGGRVQLAFADPVSAATVSPLGDSIVHENGGAAIRHSVVSALNQYVFIDSRDIGIADPVTETITDDHFDAVGSVVISVAARLPNSTLKVCLVAPAEGREGIVRARILYPEGRWSHPGFAVTGAVTLAVGCCIRGSVLSDCRAAAGDTFDMNSVTIEHPGGEIPVHWSPRHDGLPQSVTIRRDCRLLLRGAAF